MFKFAAFLAFLALVASGLKCNSDSGEPSPPKTPRKTMGFC